MCPISYAPLTNEVMNVPQLCAQLGRAGQLDFYTTEAHTGKPYSGTPFKYGIIMLLLQPKFTVYIVLCVRDDTKLEFKHCFFSFIAKRDSKGNLAYFKTSSTIMFCQMRKMVQGGGGGSL